MRSYVKKLRRKLGDDSGYGSNVHGQSEILQAFDQYTCI